jgi:hypothetical protein
VTAERIVFVVRARHFNCAIDFVGRHHHGDPHAVEPTQSVQHMRRAHHICFERSQRIAIALPHERLRREMKDDLGPRRANETGHARGIANVEEVASAQVRDFGFGKQIGRRQRRQADAGHLRASPVQRKREP